MKRHVDGCKKNASLSCSEAKFLHKFMMNGFVHDNSMSIYKKFVRSMYVTDYGSLCLQIRSICLSTACCSQ